MKAVAASLFLVLNAAAGARAAPDIAAAPAKSYSATLDGKGDPDAITCRPPQHLVSSRLLGPEVCKTNAVWAQYAKDGMEVAADGVHDVPSEKSRSLNPA